MGRYVNDSDLKLSNTKESKEELSSLGRAQTPDSSVAGLNPIIGKILLRPGHFSTLCDH